ncbi:MAG: hypothetical protein Q8K60_07065 [Parachlamydiaceae bacterium]|nr:hypothetical protein [Parachlamydiaceae bacterium]
MNLILIVFGAACFASLANFFFRKNSTTSKSVNRYMCVQYLFSFIVSVLFENFKEVPINFTMIGIGMVVGFCNVLLMILMSYALKKGPTGPIFAFQNASAMFPGLLLFISFGPVYGFNVTVLQIFGIGIVALGLCCFARNSRDAGENTRLSQWIPYALACFFIQIIALTLIQWRSLLFLDHYEHLLLPTTVNMNADIWFLPGFFGSAFILQILLLAFERKKQQLEKFSSEQPFREMTLGLFGGIANGFSTLFLAFATKNALPFEKVMLFPCFAVFVIVLCSAWAWAIYKEKFDFTSNMVCSIGIMIGKLY